MRSRLGEGIAAQRYRAVEVPGHLLDGAHENERLGAGTIISSFRQCLFCEHAGARQVAGPELGNRRHDRPSVPPFAILLRRQPTGALAQLRGDGRYTADAGDDDGLVERRGNLGVRALRRERKVASPPQWIADDRSKGRVRRAPHRFVCLLVDARREERVGEAQTVRGSHDHPVRDRRLERVLGAGLPQHVRLRLPGRGQEHERLPRRAR